MKQNTEKTWIKPKMPISLSINPDDNWQFTSKPYLDRIIKLRNKIRGIFLDSGYDYYLVMEISEPRHTIQRGTIGYRLHFHGVVYMNDEPSVCKFLLETVYRLTRHCRVDIDTIADLDDWLKYIHKQKLVPKKLKVISNYLKITDCIKVLKRPSV